MPINSQQSHGFEQPAWCIGCGESAPCNKPACNMIEEPGDECTDPKGHEWAYTGTAYGGDDESYFGEGRCYCIHCGADGDA